MTILEEPLYLCLIEFDKFCREWFLITEDSLVVISGGLCRWVTRRLRNKADSDGS
jgi:hypothetical protein